MQVENAAAGAERFTSNAWLVDGTVLVDAGSDPAVLEAVDAGLDTVLVTHSHHDHIENLPVLVDRFDVDVHAFAPENLPVAAQGLADGDTVASGDDRFDVVHTPGHRDDHVCFHVADHAVLFAGDLVFPGGEFGRTDLEQGDRDRLISSIETIARLDIDRLYAGHGDAATEDVADRVQDSLAAARDREPKYG
ncbi:MAG: MBL fold metallo-hydrolase [Candidatus Nanohaloarchaea archaeon]|nr:MBL fold metallo-hydrolase [Candidatus Nanohaloarchaea archaeon]